MNKKVSFTAGSLALFLLLAAVSCNKTKTVKPERKAITEAVYASGFIIAQDEYKVYALFEGVDVGSV